VPIIPLEVVVDDVSGGNKVSSVVNKKSSSYDLFDRDFALLVGDGGAGDGNDGQFCLFDCLGKRIGLGKRTPSQGNKYEQKDFSHSGYVSFKSIISGNCTVQDMGDSLYLACSESNAR
jgi:hypothetical protein